MEELRTWTKMEIKKGSKSFAFASLFFSQEKKQACWELYSWCRHCDDVIDKAPNRDESLRRLSILERQVREVYAGRALDESAFRAFAQVVQAYKIPMRYPLDLLRGFRMDVEGRHYYTVDEVEEYSYCVAGVVGLMMCYIMGVSDNKALKHAVDLGIAMQITNICRDVKEDYENGRVYLPDEYVRDRSIPMLMDSRNWTLVSEAQRRLLAKAEACYTSGIQGLQYLSLRSAWVILMAALIYREIGQKIIRAGVLAIQDRVIVGLGKKIFIMVKASFMILSALPKRILSPWKQQADLVLWSKS